MTVIVVGFRNFSTASPCEVVYCGASGEDANKAAEGCAGKGYVRLGKLVNPQFYQMALPVAAEPVKDVPKETKKK